MGLERLTPLQDPLAFSDPSELIVGPHRAFRLSAAEVSAARVMATEIVGSSDPASAIVKFVHLNVRETYGLSRYKRGPLAVLESGRGDCLEAHVVATMLLRALGIPCRFVSEIAAAQFEPGQALAALLRKSAAGPWTNSHVWAENWDGDAWRPLDATFGGVSGFRDWIAERLRPDGGRFGWRFPLQLRSRDADGGVGEDLSERYLIEPFAEQRESAAFREWEADIAYFRQLRRESPYLGARLTLQGDRLRRMTGDLKLLLAGRRQLAPASDS